MTNQEDMILFLKKYQKLTQIQVQDISDDHHDEAYIYQQRQIHM